jgi:hypothetical protein
VIHDLRTGKTEAFGPSPEDQKRLLAHDPVPEPSLLFLRGYASPDWLKAVGDKFGVSAELYRRHLHYKTFTSGRRDFYSLSGLPSSSAPIFQLSIPTICTRNPS